MFDEPEAGFIETRGKAGEPVDLDQTGKNGLRGVKRGHTGVP